MELIDEEMLIAKVVFLEAEVERLKKLLDITAGLQEMLAGALSNYSKAVENMRSDVVSLGAVVHELQAIAIAKSATHGFVS